MCCWGTVKNRVGPLPALTGADSSATRILVNVLLGGAAIMSTYFGVFYLIGHWFAYAGICSAVAVISTLVLSLTWYIPLRREELERSKPPSR